MSIRKGNDIIASTPAVDTVPQQGSANVITSGGVYTALQDYVTLSTPQTITANKAFNGAKISTNSDIEFTSVVAGLVSNRNGTIRNLITRTSFNEVNVGNPYDPTVVLGSGVRPRYNTLEYLALYSDIPGNFTGATAADAGTNGLVPAPAAGDQTKFLCGDGTWTNPTAATAWGNITGTLSNQTDLYNALTNKANDNAVVHLAGTETITGQKTVQNQNFIQSTTSTSLGTYVDFKQEINGGRRGTIRTTYNNDGSYSILLGNNGPNAAAPDGITVKRDSNGTTSTTVAPAASSSTSDKYIATTGWVNNSTMSTNVVHRDSSETITGSKTFTNTIKTSFSSQYPNGLQHTSTLIPNNYSSPSSDMSVVTNALMSNAGDFCAYESMSKTAAGVTSASLSVRNRASSSSPNRNAAIGVSIDSTGNITTYAPASDTNGSIVTTVNKSKSSNGYFKLGNGLIVQWGVIPSEAANTHGSVSLPTAFSTTNYSVFIGFTTSVSNGYGVFSYDYETTKFKYNTQTYAPVGSNSEKRWIAIGY